MAFEHYAQNPETGEYVGWSGTEWAPVHPREVPGTTAYEALQRQPAMQQSERRMQQDARRPIGKRIANVAGGFWDMTGGVISDLKEQGAAVAEKAPGMRLVAPFLPESAVMVGGLADSVQRRYVDAKQAARDGDPLRFAGDAISIASAPIGGTAFADIADEINNDPDRALGQAMGVGATFMLPKAAKAGMKKTGPIGRSMQRAGAERGALAVGAKRLPEIEQLYEVNEAGVPHGPMVDLLQSKGGLPIAATQKSLRNKLVARDRAAGKAVGAVKSAIEPGQYIFDQSMVDNVLMKAIDAEIAKRTNKIGGKPSTRPDGRPLGATTADTTAIDHLAKAKEDILASMDPATGKLDLSDLFNKLNTWDDVYEKARVRNNGALDITSREFTDKMAADSIRNVLGDNIPELGKVNKEFHGVRTARETLEKRLNADPVTFGPRAKRYMAYILGGAGVGGGIGAIPGAMVAGGAAAIETIGAILQSTPIRTWSANTLYKFGRFLEAGELAQAARAAQQAQAEVAAGAGAAGMGGEIGTAGRPTAPSPTATATAALNGSAAVSNPRLPAARRLPQIEAGNPYGPGPILEAEIIEGPTASAAGMNANALGGGARASRALPSGPRSLPMLPPAPVDSLPGGGVRLRSPIQVGEPGGLPARPQQTITPTKAGTTPRAPTPIPNAPVAAAGIKAASPIKPAPRLAPYDEVKALFDKRNEVVAEGAAKTVERGDANLQLKEIAAQRDQRIPVAKPKTAAKPAAASPPMIPDPASQLEAPKRGSIAPKPMPKQPAPAAEPSPVNYSTMDEPSLRSELRKAIQVRDTARKMSAGSNMFRKAEERVKQIEEALRNAKPTRISANRKGQRIEGVLARSFATANGKAMVVRADDGSERLVFENEVG